MLYTYVKASSQGIALEQMPGIGTLSYTKI